MLLVLTVLKSFCECKSPPPSCDVIDEMKSEIQNFVDGERSFIPTAVRFGENIF